MGETGSFRNYTQEEKAKLCLLKGMKEVAAKISELKRQNTELRTSLKKEMKLMKGSLRKMFERGVITQKDFEERMKFLGQRALSEKAKQKKRR